MTEPRLSLTPEQARYAVRCFSEWLNHPDAKHGKDTSPHRLAIDARHSAFLGRLLSGKDPLPTPPPRAFSYPWYAIVEESEKPHQCQVYDHGNNAPGRLHINQASWKIEERCADGSFRVSHERLPGQVFRVRQVGEDFHGWEIQAEIIPSTPEG